MGYLCANVSLPRPLCSRLRPDVRDRETSDRQTDVRHASSLNASALWGGGIIIDEQKLSSAAAATALIVVRLQLSNRSGVVVVTSS